MGGTGSGRWTYHNRKRTVEECWAMSIFEVDRVLDFSKPGSFSHLFRPTIPKTGKRMSPVRCMSKLGDDGKPLLGLSYTVKDKQGLEHRVEEVLRLQTTRPTFGGVRWWFSCPRMLDGEECGRRVGKLYRPPGSRYLRLSPLPRPDLRELPEEPPLRRAVRPGGGGSLGGVLRGRKAGFLLPGEGSEEATGRVLADAVGGLRRGVWRGRGPLTRRLGVAGEAYWPSPGTQAPWSFVTWRGIC